MKITDPVCGKKLDIDQVAETMEHDNWLYFFCSVECRRRFKAQPNRYVSNIPKPKSSSTHNERAKRKDHA